MNDVAGTLHATGVVSHEYVYKEQGFMWSASRDDL